VISVHCPRCDRSLEIDDGEPFAACYGCGHEFEAEDMIAAPPDPEEDRPTWPSIPPPSTHACTMCDASLPGTAGNKCTRCWELYHRLGDFEPWMNTKAGRAELLRVATRLANMLLLKRDG